MQLQDRDTPGGRPRFARSPGSA